MIVVPMGFARGSYQTGLMAALRDAVGRNDGDRRPEASGGPLGRVGQAMRRVAAERPLSRSEVAYRLWQERTARAR